MISFQKRSYDKELLDKEHIPFDDIKRNMKELDLINRYLGGHDITLDGIVQFIQNAFKFNNEWYIAEIGCGGGDNLRAIKTWARHVNLPVRLTGIDINHECITYARENELNKNITFITSDYRLAVLEPKPDILFSSLFCHHFTDEELIYMLQWMKRNAHSGFFINDLHRHPLAYYSIKLLTLLFSRSYLVKNDAPLSVKRGFKRKDWSSLLHQAGIYQYTCEWKWAFRWLIICSNEHGE